MLRLQERPDGAVNERLIVELKPFWAVSVIVELPEDPVWKLIGPLEDIVKPGLVEPATFIVTDVVCVL